MPRPIAGCLLLLLTVTLAGCGVGSDGPRQRAQSTEYEFTDILRRTVSFDYDPYPSPESMRQDVDFAGVGQVDSISSAMIDEPVGPDSGAVVIGIRLDEVWKQDRTSSENDVAYFVVFRPTNIRAEDFAKSLGSSTRVALFGDTSTLTLASGNPDGPVYEPSPQGLIVESAHANTANVWGAEVNSDYPGWSGATSIDGIRSSLRLR